ncbi:MAG TPA: APC family permease, partial [Candidatus Limnocylindrales bacterium]|nr:APC family permease [Candidatus Limnocylindrales bacterium]
LATMEESEQRLSKTKALAVFSSDALSSVAYATEAILFTLAVAGPEHFWLVLPISGVIVAILFVVAVSYRQTITAYPNGGGSYIVAKENLGTLPGLIAAAALLVDYVLTVSVSVAAGVAALISAFPALENRTLWSLVAIALVMLVNLRGIKESGTIFAIPTYVFVIGMIGLIAVGLGEFALGQSPRVADVTAVASGGQALGALLILRAFADGCSAMTGVEAISNGVPAFKRPEPINARTTLAAMAILLGTMFIGISVLSMLAGSIPSEHETILSQITRAIFGTGPVYYVLTLATTSILILAANTSFADFPRLASLLAKDRYMPSRFAFRGERLAFSAGIVALAVLAGVVVAAFAGRVEALIPLYAIGVFTCFTLSQAGMVVHWRRDGGPGWRRRATVNGIGAVATAIVALIFAIAKFALGAWIVIIIIPLLVGLMAAIHHEYARASEELDVSERSVIRRPHRRQTAYVPMTDLRRDVVHAVRFGQTLSDEVVGIFVTDDPGAGEALRKRMARQLPGVRLVVVESPYRELVAPLVRYLEQAAKVDPESVSVLLLPEYVQRHWWERFLYNSNQDRIRRALLGNKRILVANVPYRRPA